MARIYQRHKIFDIIDNIKISTFILNLDLRIMLHGGIKVLQRGGHADGVLGSIATPSSSFESISRLCYSFSSNLELECYVVENSEVYSSVIPSCPPPHGQDAPLL